MDANDLGPMKSDLLKSLWCDLPEVIGVYMIKTPSKRYYYGYSKNIRQRIRLHCSDACRGAHNNKRLAASLLKYGSRCKVDVVQVCETEEQAIELEEQYIKMFFFDSNNMNQTDASPKKVLKAWERPDTRVSYIMSIWSMQVVLFYSIKDRQRWLNKNGNGTRHTNCYVKGYSVKECKEKAIRAQLKFLWNARGGGNCVFNNEWHRTIADAFEENKSILKAHGIGAYTFQRYMSKGCNSLELQIQHRRKIRELAGRPGVCRNNKIIEWDNKKYRRIGDLDKAMTHVGPVVLRKAILLGVNTTNKLELLLKNCTDRKNMTCELKIFMVGRWFSSYQSCQDYTGMSFKRLKANED